MFTKKTKELIRNYLQQNCDSFFDNITEIWLHHNQNKFICCNPTTNISYIGEIFIENDKISLSYNQNNYNNDMFNDYTCYSMSI